MKRVRRLRMISKRGWGGRSFGSGAGGTTPFELGLPDRNRTLWRFRGPGGV